MTARDIAEYSHQEEPYDGEHMGESIPYSKAITLSQIALDLTPQPLKSFADTARDIASSIPDEDLANIPPDASSNLDYCLYGGPKQKKWTKYSVTPFILKLL